MESKALTSYDKDAHHFLRTNDHKNIIKKLVNTHLEAEVDLRTEQNL
jgi:hypothetical protein